jgi:hypothetical protein
MPYGPSADRGHELEGASRHCQQPGCYADGAASASLDRPLLSVGTARDRRYGHAEVTAGEDDAGSGRAATVTSLTGG